MKTINLSQGFITFVDDEDFELLNQWKWTLQTDKKHFYAYRFNNINGKKIKIFMHRVIMKTARTSKIDHIDGNGLNNQKANMRICTSQQNSFNLKFRQGCTSVFKGVSWSKTCNKWESYIHHNWKKITLGYFDSERQAATVYNKAALSLFGEFAKLNQVNQ